MPVHFQVSAPGKVILHGEHSVVYGKPALAGVIGLRNKLVLKEIDGNKLKLNFPCLRFKIEIDLATINQFIKDVRKAIEGDVGPDEIDFEKLLAMCTDMISHLPDTINDVEKKTLWAVLFLASGILLDNDFTTFQTSIDIRIESEMSIGSGLGSSASFGVCLASAFYFYTKTKKSKKYLTDEYPKLDEETLKSTKEYISQWAFCSERIMHGNPSGLDNTICTFGNVVKFFRGQPPTPIQLQQPLNVLLIDTKVARSTAKLVADVAALKTEHPAMMEGILEAMGALVEDASDVLVNLSTKSKSYEFEKLERLVKINNNLLRAIGVSHESLESIFAISDTHKFSAKLTGAGGGGYAMILLPPNFKDLISYRELCEELTKNSLAWICTTIGGTGIEVEELA